MLFFMLLLQTVPAESDPAAEPAFPRILDRVAQDCADGACEAGRRYRLRVEVAHRGEDPKNQALRGNWQPCGTTGAAVCASKPHRILRTDLD
ncbi:hypothetical protein OF829_07665 [Sphingomonas sp. LB-2]|uniref:hypothetical protein n=1 Tax=Sphingomonas caeni TaxID=2984949 RepID=UPI002231B50C|nr:hypothetical protein [Sphingomonas caeni]MCW3847113.1 hypothetical protein [Sphingomonas caeni]